MINKLYEPDSSFMKAGMSEIWDYKKLEEGSVFFGEYRYMESNVGENNSNLYTFMAHEDEKFDSPTKLMSIWGSTLLDTRFKNLQKGEYVIVVYLGEAPSEKRKGKTYHNFNVYHKPAPFIKIDGEDNNGEEVPEGWDSDTGVPPHQD